MPTTPEKLSEITIPQVPASAFIGEVTYPPGGHFGPKTQTHPQLVAIHEGSLTLACPEQTVQIQSDEICLLRTGDVEFFQFSKTSPTHHSWIDLHYETDFPQVRSQLANAPRVLPLSHAMHELIRASIALRMAGCASTSIPLRHMAVAAINLFLQESSAQLRTGERTPESILAARHFIETRYADELTLDDIADAAHLSVNHLLRTFKQHLGITPTRFLWQTRTRRGIDLLRNTGLSVSEIAYRVGFQTPFHFSRLVKKLTGQSPRDLRNQHHSQTSDD